MLYFTQKDVVKSKLDKGRCGLKMMLNFNGEEYFFKSNYYNDFNQYVYQNNQEIFVYYILKKLGIKNILEYEYAQYYDGENTIEGCASKNFITNDVVREIDLLTMLEFIYFGEKDKLIDLNKNFSNDEFNEFYDNFKLKNKYINTLQTPFNHTLTQICDNITKFCEINSVKCDIQEIRKNLETMTIVDYFCCNDDRNWQNIDFLVCKKDDNLVLKLAPIFDNAFTFGARFYNNKNLTKNQIIEEAKKSYTLVGFSNLEQPQELNLSIDENKTLQNDGILALDIWKYTCQNKDIRELVDKFKNLDLLKEIELFEKEYNVSIEDRNKAIMNLFFNERVRHYKKRENKIQKLTSKEYEIVK